MKFFHYPACSSCKKAKTFLQARGLTFDAIHIVEEPPSADELAVMIAKSGKPMSKFFNTSGQSYRDGDFKNRLPLMNEAEQLAALAADGKLIKRPLLDLGDRSLVGFTESEWIEALG